MDALDKQFDDLIDAEGLADIGRLLTPRAFDEVPFVSRLSRIAFLSKLDICEQSRLLVVHALKHYERVLSFIDTKGVRDIVVLLSLTHWEDLSAADPDPVIPNFWICTHPARDLVAFRLQPGASPEANQVREWLGDLAGGYDVLDAFPRSGDATLLRVYISKVGDVRIRNLLTP